MVVCFIKALQMMRSANNYKLITYITEQVSGFVLVFYFPLLLSIKEANFIKFDI